MLSNKSLCCRRVHSVGHTTSGPRQPITVAAAASNDRSWAALGAATAAVAILCSPMQPDAAWAAGGKAMPPVVDSVGRCSMEALDLFADTRAMFSQEASSGAMTEANIDVRGCDYSGKDLTKKVLSGVLMIDADFSGAKLTGIQMARADARGANFTGADFTDINAFNTQFDGADLTNTQWENAILSNASFGQYAGKWANLKGAHFEGALLSSSDVGRVCANPTLDEETRRFELGCRGSR